MQQIKFRQPIFNEGKFLRWHLWGFIEGKFVQPSLRDNDTTIEAVEAISQMYIGACDSEDTPICSGDQVKIRGGEAINQVVFCNGAFCLLGKSAKARPRMFLEWRDCTIVTNCLTSSTSHSTTFSRKEVL